MQFAVLGLTELIEGEYRRKYAKKYGIGSLINYFHGLPWNDDESEKAYKICLDNGITWEEYYRIGKDKEVIY
jgi:hypothetical protein